MADRDDQVSLVDGLMHIIPLGEGRRAHVKLQQIGARLPRARQSDNDIGGCPRLLFGLGESCFGIPASSCNRKSHLAWPSQIHIHNHYRESCSVEGTGKDPRDWLCDRQ